MGKPNFSDEFKRNTVAQITGRGYPVAEVSQRLGVSQHSLYAWKRQLAKVVSGDADKDAEIRQLKRELARVTWETVCCGVNSALTKGQCLEFASTALNFEEKDFAGGIA